MDYHVVNLKYVEQIKPATVPTCVSSTVTTFAVEWKYLQA